MHPWLRPLRPVTIFQRKRKSGKRNGNRKEKRKSRGKGIEKKGIGERLMARYRKKSVRGNSNFVRIDTLFSRLHYSQKSSDI